MVELRDYQKKLLHRVEAALDADAKARVMMQLPTGGGKTEIAAQLLKDQLTNGRKAVLKYCCCAPVCSLRRPSRAT